MKKLIKAVRYSKHLFFSRFHHMGSMVSFERNIKVENSKLIHLGDKVNIDEDCSLAVFERYRNDSFSHDKPVIQIGDNVGLGKGTIVYAIKGVNIKKDVMIGPYCFIGDYDHQYLEVNKPIVNQPLTNADPIIIDEGSWVGAHVTISSGVRIGKNSVIGANSVVTKDIPDYSVAVGVPARVIKKYDHRSRTWKRTRN
ncbi:MAG: Transferase hexapeptide repeat containing protein [uncultured bacterium]|nr:MAG: Transferase hexapeptide repeat containing protein [uncultured bacterium]OGH13859.1 MAG: hypothetical protein A2687_04835 [Candidatus Levybacteria bacterium RIFCSPHIGHO2_01_FULL_38_26]